METGLSKSLKRVLGFSGNRFFLCFFLLNGSIRIRDVVFFGSFSFFQSCQHRSFFPLLCASMALFLKFGAGLFSVLFGDVLALFLGNFPEPLRPTDTHPVATF